MPSGHNYNPDGRRPRPQSSIERERGGPPPSPGAPSVALRPAGFTAEWVKELDPRPEGAPLHLVIFHRSQQPLWILVQKVVTKPSKQAVALTTRPPAPSRHVCVRASKGLLGALFGCSSYLSPRVAQLQVNHLSEPRGQVWPHVFISGSFRDAHARGLPDGSEAAPHTPGELITGRYCCLARVTPPSFVCFNVGLAGVIFAHCLHISLCSRNAEHTLGTCP